MQTGHIQVSGMTCGSCTDKVARALKSIPGVADVTVSLAASEAVVNYDERQTSADQLKSAVKTAGYGVGAVAATQGRPAKGGCCG